MDNTDITTDEAIEILKTHLLLPRVTGTREEEIEPRIKAEKALNMVILALKENEKLKEENEALLHINTVRDNEILQLKEENDLLKLGIAKDGNDWYNESCELHKENKQLKEQIENQTCHIKEERARLIDLQRENDCLKNTMNKINQIVNETNRRESILVNNYPKIVTRSKGFDQISEVFKDE